MNIDAIPLLNQRVWDAHLEKAKENALDSLHQGGFGSDCIERRVGNYEGQIFAIRFGWVDEHEYGWEINQKGIQALIEAGRQVPSFLPVMDSWHGIESSYCAYTKTYRGETVLELFDKAIPKYDELAMSPLLRKSDVVALRDFLNDWLDKN